MQSDAERGLDEAVEGLYRVFRRYRLPKHVEGCPHCVHDRDHDRLYSRPLRELTGDDLDLYARKALTTWGGVEDFKHFLPRLFELMALDLLKSFDYEVLVNKLSYIEWLGWPPEEVDAIRHFFMALWANVLAHQPDYPSAREWLCVIGQAEDDLLPYLATWGASGSDTALQHLVMLVDREVGDIEQRKLGDAFWEKRGAQMKQVVDWLYSPTTVSQFTAALALLKSEEAQERLRYPLEYLHQVFHAPSS